MIPATLVLLLLTIYLLLGAIFYIFYDKISKKVAKDFLIVSTLLLIATIFLSAYLTFAYNPFYIIIALLQSSTLLLNIKALKRFYGWWPWILILF